MCTEHGTSYNSYLVCGTNETAIIDANHEAFAGEWLAGIEGVLNGKEPSYLILNHTEPDHSSSLDACLAQYPSITVVCSASAAINIKNITNRQDLAIQVVKNGDSIDLGGLTLEFYSAPFLHWPDSMFTWLPEHQIAFTCDFLGTHYCEPRIFDRTLSYHDAFMTSFEAYYQAIMSPFAPWVRKGLAILDDLEPKIVATSHGPVLTKGSSLEKCIDLYREWSVEQPSSPERIALFYCSAYGYTQALAEHIAVGISTALPEAKVSLYDLVGANLAHLGTELNRSTAFLIGSPTVNKAALPTVWNLLAHIDAINIVKRPVALFGSYGWSGEALPQLAAHLTTLKAKVFDTQLSVRFAPSEADLAAAEEFGKEFALSLLA